jgi:hypothetical protein
MVFEFQERRELFAVEFLNPFTYVVCELRACIGRAPDGSKIVLIFEEPGEPSGAVATRFSFCIFRGGFRKNSSDHSVG